MSVRLAGGSYALPPLIFDAQTLASEVRLVGEEGAELRLIEGPSRRRLVPTAASSVLFTVRDGAPPVRLENLRITGALQVDGGSLVISSCTLGRSSATLRALSLSGGEVFVEHTTFCNTTSGGVGVTGGRLELSDSVLRDNQAETGGALHVTGGNVRVARCRLENNRATVEGGGLHASGGAVELGNRTLLLGNTAPSGASISATEASLSYVLPAPLARYVSASLSNLQLFRKYAYCSYCSSLSPGICNERRHVPVSVCRLAYFLGLPILLPKSSRGQHI